MYMCIYKVNIFNNMKIRMQKLVGSGEVYIERRYTVGSFDKKNCTFLKRKSKRIITCMTSTTVRVLLYYLCWFYIFSKT